MEKACGGLTEPFGPIDCGNSGTGIRLMTGLLAGQDFFTVLTGDESIRRRPMGRVVKPLRAMGATIAGRKGGELAPLAITGTRLTGMSYSSPVASAQIKSSLLFAALYADGMTTIAEPRLSRDHTERMFAYFGIPLRRDGLYGSDRRTSVGPMERQDGRGARGPLRGGIFCGRGVDCAGFGCDASRRRYQSHSDGPVGNPASHGRSDRCAQSARRGR